MLPIFLGSIMLSRIEGDYSRRTQQPEITKQFLILRIGSFELHGGRRPCGRHVNRLRDHRSQDVPGRRKRIAGKAKSFGAQLMAYRTALEKATKLPVLSTWIHFPISGYLVNVRINAAVESFLQQCIKADGMNRPSPTDSVGT